MILTSQNMGILSFCNPVRRYEACWGGYASSAEGGYVDISVYGERLFSSLSFEISVQVIVF